MWLAVDMVGVPAGGYPDKDKDAGWSGFLLPEACVTWREIVYVP